LTSNLTRSHSPLLAKRRGGSSRRRLQDAGAADVGLDDRACLRGRPRPNRKPSPQFAHGTHLIDCSTPSRFELSNPGKAVCDLDRFSRPDVPGSVPRGHDRLAGQGLV
jgi:hypothetical protein